MKTSSGLSIRSTTEPLSVCLTQHVSAARTHLLTEENSNRQESHRMSRKTLFVWLAAAIACVSMAFLPTNSAYAQLTFGEPTLTCVTANGGDPAIVDDAADMVILTVIATYSMDDYECSDLTLVGLDPNPGLGVLTPALVATASFNCPTDPVNGLYVMNSVCTANTGLNGSTQMGTCRVVATLEFHPECVSVLAGDDLPFNITWRVNDPVLGETCIQQPNTVEAPCDMETDCCIWIAYAEYGGYARDGIIAIDDRVWLDSINVAIWDSTDKVHAHTFDHDTVYWQRCRKSSYRRRHHYRYSERDGKRHPGLW
jgi:hypothetical protein